MTGLQIAMKHAYERAQALNVNVYVVRVRAAEGASYKALTDSEIYEFYNNADLKVLHVAIPRPAGFKRQR